MRAICLNPRGRGLNLAHIHQGVRGFLRDGSDGRQVSMAACQSGSTTPPR
jgi:hypothetical protein